MNLAQAKYKSKFCYDQKQNTQYFREGEMVYLMKKPKHGKRDREYVGPCEIIEINYSTHNAKIQKGEQTRTVHLNLLKRSYELPKGTENRDLSISELISFRRNRRSCKLSSQTTGAHSTYIPKTRTKIFHGPSDERRV